MESIKEAKAICAHSTQEAKTLCSTTIKEAKAICGHSTKEAKTLCSTTIREAETRGASQAGSLQQSHAKSVQHLEEEAIKEESKGQLNFLSHLSSCPMSQPCQTLQHAGSFLPHIAGTCADIPYFRSHCLNFNNEISHDFRDVCWCMIKTAGLLGSTIYEIKESWTGQDELQQANYVLRTLPKGLKFFRAVSPSESPKVMGLMGIHNTDVLHCFNGLTHWP